MAGARVAWGSSQHCPPGCPAPPAQPMAARRPLFRPSNRAAVGSRPSSREEQGHEVTEVADGEPTILEERRQLHVSPQNYHLHVVLLHWLPS